MSTRGIQTLTNDIDQDMTSSSLYTHDRVEFVPFNFRAYSKLLHTTNLRDLIYTLWPSEYGLTSEPELIAFFEKRVAVAYPEPHRMIVIVGNKVDSRSFSERSAKYEVWQSDVDEDVPGEEMTVSDYLQNIGLPIAYWHSY